MVVGSDTDEISAAMTYGETSQRQMSLVMALPSTNYHLPTYIYCFLKHPRQEGALLFENRKLEIKENYNSYNEIDDRKIVCSEVEVSIIRLFDYSIISQVSC